MTSDSGVCLPEQSIAYTMWGFTVSAVAFTIQQHDNTAMLEPFWFTNQPATRLSDQ